jgi:hypothetical protein
MTGLPDIQDVLLKGRAPRETAEESPEPSAVAVTVAVDPARRRASVCDMVCLEEKTQKTVNETVFTCGRGGATEPRNPGTGNARRLAYEAAIGPVDILRVYHYAFRAGSKSHHPASRLHRDALPPEPRIWR